MNDGERVIVMVLDKRPIAYGRKIHTRLGGVREIACKLGKNFALFISYETTVPVDRGHTSHTAVGSLRLCSFILKPFIESEGFKFHGQLNVLCAWTDG